MHKKTSISNQTPDRKTTIQGGSLARRGDKFKGSRSQHRLGFYIFCFEAMKSLEAADLSIVQAFPIIGNNFEGNTSHVVEGIFYFVMKKTCKK